MSTVNRTFAPVRICEETKASTNKPTLHICLKVNARIYGGALLLVIHNMEDLPCQSRWYFTAQ